MSIFISSCAQPYICVGGRRLGEVRVLFSQKYTVTVTEEMHERLEEERKRRLLHSIPETIRMIVSEYLYNSNRG